MSSLVGSVDHMKSGTTGMTVLLLTQVLPYPPDAGPKVKTYNVIKYLAQQHEVTLASFIRAGEEKYVDELRRYCAAVHTVKMGRSKVRDARFLTKSLLSTLPFLIARDWSDEMADLIRGLLRERQFDVVHADQLSMAQYARLARGAQTVLDEHNAVFTIVKRLAEAEGWRWRRLFLDLEWRKLMHYEGAMCRAFDHVLTVIDEDREALSRASGGRGNFTTVPIAVDTAETRPVRRNPQASDVVSVATMFYPPNVDAVLWFAKEVFPLVERDEPAARFHVVGARPPTSVQCLAERDKRVVVTGYVQELQPILQDAAALVVPLRAGSGMRVKILEAFARGIPVVATSIGCEGIDVTSGENILIADTAEGFAAAVSRLIHDRDLGEKLAAEARRLVEERYDWREACKGMDKVYCRDTPLS